MDRENVTSSNISSIGYDAESQTLEIEFLNGAIYQYFDVPEQVHAELMGADSVGAFLARNIKGSFRYSRV
ncbi:KTSC domain-containing protein [Serratia marcescens]|uniref:KTSC domain-containing protein n=1 Tax=Serratia marcescens TaxID=615 RepID=UPI0029ED0FD1|nr:KTSC domain-containing protein [Serratia marcescens]